jgi:SAM-dependent methyltransferase
MNPRAAPVTTPQEIAPNRADDDPQVAARTSTGVVAPADLARLGDLIARWLGLGAGDRVLHVGCGDGALTAQWRDRAAGCVGVDCDARLAAGANARRGGRGGVAFAGASAAALPFADASFDCVVCLHVLPSLPDHDGVRRAIGELLRVATADARFVLGSLPDLRCQQRFLDVQRHAASLPRRVGMAVQGWLRPRRPARASILWFDIDDLSRDLRRQGLEVAIYEDPLFSNYRYYRKTLVLRRGAAKERR